jgi:hypothetical protein
VQGEMLRMLCHDQGIDTRDHVNILNPTRCVQLPTMQLRDNCWKPHLRVGRYEIKWITSGSSVIHQLWGNCARSLAALTPTQTVTVELLWLSAWTISWPAPCSPYSWSFNAG